VDLSGKPLEELLHTRFGFAGFRPGQQAVCRALMEGNDALLVMPTGAGKSLCYQLPGIARGGTTLVVSPLIALMEDQAAKLRALGFNAERIHSGRDRASSRQVCLDYLKGALDFLFIAPERLRVAGFPEMLAKRTPSLVAIDEAHCISQWGHDFRPDYRMLGQHVPSFRPAPVLALTATATPIVQDDIAGQLNLAGPRFIQGFRRDNIAIEVVEAQQSRRGDLAIELLEDDARRPAIVYVPARREADSLAVAMKGHFSAAAYHAGLDAARRAKVQTAFLDGKLDVMVATIAFGMGIDKANIRTIIHTALPGSMEAYYQEIGRAGRDGGPSRAILMQSYSDRRTHDFFFERDYPESDVLARIYSVLGPEPQAREEVAMRSRINEDVFAPALEKLWIHGGALVDYNDEIARGDSNWRPSYEAQRNQKEAQLEQMLRFADSGQCRMTTLVRHFGDLTDARRACGVCDFCAPDDCIAQSFRGASALERGMGWKVIEALRVTNGSAAGRLHAELGGEREIDRRTFERLLGGLARHGYVQLTEASFEKDGRRIDFKKAFLTTEGRQVTEAELQFSVTEPAVEEKKRKKKTKAVRKAAARAAVQAEAPVAAADDAAEKALKAWRLAEAKRQSVPAFRILTDKTLRVIAAQKPRSTSELIAIPGMGLRAVEKYGAAIFRVLHASPAR
jgi:RecQ family ATP-dependent DNA helicase